MESEPEVQDVTSTTQNPTPPKKFIAIFDDPVRGIVIQAGGITMEEGIVLVTKGYFKFKEQFEEYIRITIR